MDVPLTDLRRHQPLALEDADRVPAESDEDRSDAVVLADRLEERSELDTGVLLLVPERERRPGDDRPLGGLDANAPVCVERASRRALQGCQPLDDVGATDVARAVSHAAPPRGRDSSALPSPPPIEPPGPSAPRPLLGP